MAKSRIFGSRSPERPHLVEGPGGLGAEVADLRGDTEAAFEQLLAEAHGTTTQRTALGTHLTTDDAGHTFWDSTLSKLYTWNGTAWVVTAAGGTVSGTTATNNSGTAAVTAGTTVTGISLASYRSPKLAVLPPTAMPVKGVAMHLQDPGGAALNLVAGFTLPLPRRNLEIIRSNAGPASVDYVVTGKAPDGTVISETISAAINATTAGLLAFDVIDSIVTSVDPVSTTDFKTGVGFGIGEAFTAASAVLSVDGVVESIVSQDIASGTIVPTTPPDGTKTFCVQYLTVSHNHAITDAGHTHSVADSGHTHSQNSHTHTLS